MIKLALASASALAALLPLQAAASPGPTPVPPTAPVADPQDIPYPGTIRLHVDATDTDHRVVRIKETVPVSPAGGPVTLLYPEWLPGTHAPEGPIDKLAGLTISAAGAPAAWTRDPSNPFAFHVTTPAGAQALDVSFEYLSPVQDKVGATEISSDIANLEWNALVLYPAGYFARQIPVAASLTLPTGWTSATALGEESSGSGAGAASGEIRYGVTDLETLVDSPVYAGRFARTYDLDPGGPARVRLNVFADRPSELEIKPEALAAHRALVRQAYKLYGSRHYDHYDFLFTISDVLHDQGLEHHQSSEDNVGEGYFSDYDKAVSDRSLFPHEYTHSWNGKFRRPADLWTPNYNTRMRDSLLWVYEGQTEYWGEVLTARSGLRTPEQEREALALLAAAFDHLPGRAWRPLQDTVNDEIINPRRPLSWPTYQRFEDYYDEGALIWLDADTLIRERSGGKRSLDTFAKAFFGVDTGSHADRTYTFEDLTAALNAVEPYDWASFLRTRLDAVGRGAPFDGIKRSGYALVYTDQPNLILTSSEGQSKSKSFAYSLGFRVGHGGELTDVQWDSPAFKAGLTQGMTLMAVNGYPYTDQVLEDQLKAAQTGRDPLEVIVKTPDRFKTVRIDYHGGVRYPHLQRDAAHADLLDAILAAK